MPRFVAFLRAINVGGHTATKEKLKEVFSAAGFGSVSTFKQSGNVVFETKSANQKAIQECLEEILRGMLGFDVAVFVRTFRDLRELVKLNPFKGVEEPETDFQVTFLSKAVDPFPLVLPLRISNSTADLVAAKGTEVFSVTRGHGDGGKPNPFLEKTLKQKATTRNWNVVKEIARIEPEAKLSFEN
jgi:uncharacterized protein (DUF1697 family)